MYPNHASVKMDYLFWNTVQNTRIFFRGKKFKKKKKRENYSPFLLTLECKNHKICTKLFHVHTYYSAQKVKGEVIITIIIIINYNINILTSSIHYNQNHP